MNAAMAVLIARAETIEIADRAWGAMSTWGVAFTPSSAAPNVKERQLARQIGDALGFRDSVETDPYNVAGLLALVREGYTLAGPRQLVSGIVHLDRVAVHVGAVERATEHAWHPWFRELHRLRLRPCGWPTPTFDDPTSPVYTEVDAEGPWDYLRISVTCEAVPGQLL